MYAIKTPVVYAKVGECCVRIPSKEILVIFCFNLTCYDRKPYLIESLAIIIKHYNCDTKHPSLNRFSFISVHHALSWQITILPCGQHRQPISRVSCHDWSANYFDIKLSCHWSLIWEQWWAKQFSLFLKIQAGQDWVWIPLDSNFSGRIIWPCLILICGLPLVIMWTNTTCHLFAMKQMRAEIEPRSRGWRYNRQPLYFTLTLTVLVTTIDALQHFETG